ncbi:MAG: sigma-E processing peptidase SpoIIGA [Clostridia bacterium]|nr:sigma-E processing peptidase SpoIIGA [Clostridia bacterium]
MTIYIEEFLLQNIIINFCLLRLLYVSTKYRTNNLKLVSSAIVGAVFSAVSAMFLTDQMLINILKLVCSFLMIFISFNLKTKQFIFSYILLFVYTYALGGALMSFASNSQITTSGIIMQSNYSLELITLFIVLLTYIFELSLKHTKNKILNNNYIYKIQLKSGKNTLKINAFIDTGNNLSYNGKSVMILDNQCFFKLMDIKTILNKDNTILKVATISGVKNLRIHLLDEVKIFSNNKPKIIKNQYVAIDQTNSFSSTNYQALLSPSMI